MGLFIATYPGGSSLLGAQDGFDHTGPALQSASKLAPSGIPRGRPEYELRLGKERLRFDPRSELDLQRLAQALQAKLNRPRAGARRTSSEKRFRRGLQQLQRLAETAAACSEPAPKNALITSVLETLEAINNSQRPPVPARVDVLQTPWLFQRQFHRPVARGQEPATNLQPGPQEDLSQLNPLPSTFWQAPPPIAKQDLYHGFGRASWWQIQDKLCDYSGPKESYGLNPGFDVDCEGRKFKLKFAEISSEPFATRIFAALGYNADPTDYAPRVRIHYARALFREFNSRRPLGTRFTFLGVLPLYKMELQRRYDPFAYITEAVLRDGRHWSGRELRSQLFRDSARRFPESDPANFRPEVESDIEYLVTVPANFQETEVRGKSIGPWDFGQLDHANRRELRGAGLLAGWLGWFDTRFDNTRLRIVQHDGHAELAHYISDLGGVLGETSGLLYARGELPNAFPWAFTRPPLRQGPHRMAIALRLEGYKPIAQTAAFEAMTIDDARWLARLLGQLTERQLVEALVASGYDSAEVRLYTEKLLSRRDRMIIDLGLSDEMPLCRPGGVDRKLTYDPVANGPVSIDVPGQSQIQAPIGRHRIVGGKLIER